MNHEMIIHLVRKDWTFQRWTLAFYLALGALGLAIIQLAAGESAFFVGSILLIAAVMGVGIHLIMATVVLERKEKNLAFVMSLPVSVMGYTSAKILANLSAFLLPWLALLGSALWLIRSSQGMPDGLEPFTVIVLGELAAAYVIMLAVAIVSESESWTVLAVVVLNLGFSLFLYWVSHLPEIGDHIEGPVAEWNRTAVGLLLAEAAVIVLVLVATFALQARKKDFL
ncbi:MAG: ABC-2 transporter permease [Thermoanaerobaculia bacterium]|nr:ABC-2 transporter permease [Thermoanaerobaculia bacterium]